MRRAENRVTMSNMDKLITNILLVRIICYMLVLQRCYSQQTVHNQNRSLPETCHNSCGVQRTLPCSCHHHCFILGNCCEDISTTCPKVKQIAMEMYGRTPDRGLTVCHKSSVLMIETCPSALKKIRDKSLNTRNVTNTNVGLKNVKASEHFLTTISVDLPKEIVKEPLQRPQLADGDSEKLLQNGPVTDNKTGITYVNRTIYECFVESNDSGNVVLDWNLRVIPGKTRSLEQLNSYIHRGTFEPSFHVDMLSYTMCYPNAVSTCSKTDALHEMVLSYSDLCQTSSTSYVVTRNKWGRDTVYRNRYCMYCNEGEDVDTHDSYPKFQNAKNNFGFSYLVKLSETDHFEVYPESSDTRFISRFPWSKAECSTQDTSDDDGNSNRPICSVECNMAGHYVLRPDGVCKAKHRFLIGIAHDSLKRACQSTQKKLHDFLYCALQKLMPELDLGQNSSEKWENSTYFSRDTRSGKDIFFVKITLNLEKIDDMFFGYIYQFEVTEKLAQLRTVIKAFISFNESDMDNFCNNTSVDRVISTVAVGNSDAGVLGTHVGTSPKRNTVKDTPETTVCLSRVWATDYVEGSAYPIICLDDHSEHVLEDTHTQRTISSCVQNSKLPSNESRKSRLTKVEFLVLGVMIAILAAYMQI